MAKIILWSCVLGFLGFLIGGRDRTIGSELGVLIGIIVGCLIGVTVNKLKENSNK